jgi:hypothetical protein
LRFCQYQEGIRIDWMNNVERLTVSDNTKAVDILLTKLQRHRGDTLNSGIVIIYFQFMLLISYMRLLVDCVADVFLFISKLIDVY